MALDHNFFAPGSGIGPQSTGFAPTPGEAFASQLRRSSAEQLMAYSLYSDPRARTMQGAIARGLAGDAASAQSLMRGTGGALIKDATAALLQSGLVPGGNPANLAYAVQNLTASQGFRISGNVAGGQLFGSGAVTDTLSLKMFDRLRSNFFDATTGLAKGGAYGMDMNTMSQAVQTLGNRGVFAGQRIGETSYFSNPTQIREALAAARKEGGQEDFIKDLEGLASGPGRGFATKIDKNVFKKVSDTIKSFTTTMNDAKEVFGEMSIPELTQAAERLIGTTVAEAGSTEVMQGRMASLKGMASAFGQSSQALANNTLQNISVIQNAMLNSAMANPLNTSQPYSQIGLNTATARAAAAVGFNAQMATLPTAMQSREYASLMAQKGVHVRDFSMQDIQASTAAGTSALMREGGNRYAAVALRAMDQGLVTGESKDRINTLIDSLSGARNRQATAAIGAQINAELSKSGINASAILGTESMEQITAGMKLSSLDKFAEVNQQQYAARSFNAIGVMRRTGQDRGLLTTNKKQEAFYKLMSTMDASSFSALTDAVGAAGSIDEAKFKKLYADNKTLAANFTPEELKSLVGTIGASGQELGALGAVFKSNPMTADLGNKMSRDEAEKNAIQKYIAGISLGKNTLTKEGILEMGIRGIFNKGKISDAALLQYAKNAGSDQIASLGLNADYTALNISGGDIDSLTGAIGADKVSELYKKFNIKPGDKAGLAKALSADSKGLTALSRMLGDTAAEAAGGKLNILGASGKQKAFDALEKDVMLGQARTILGDEKFGEGADLTTQKGREDFNAQLSDKLLSDPERFVKLAQEAEMSGYSGQTFEAVAAEYSKNPAFAKALQEKEDKLRATKDEDQVKQANSIRNLRNKIDVDSGASKFLGILELTGEGLSQIKLFSSN